MDKAHKISCHCESFCETALNVTCAYAFSMNHVVSTFVLCRVSKGALWHISGAFKGDLLPY